MSVSYHRRKALGLCTECGKVAPVVGQLRCASCIEIDRTKYKANKKITKSNVNLQDTIKAASEAGLSYGQYVAQNSEGMKWRIGLNDNKR